MATFIDRALHPAAGRFKWLLAAIFLSPLAGYISTGTVAAAALIEALRFRDILRAIRSSRAARITAVVLILFFCSIFFSDLIQNHSHRWWSDFRYLLPIAGPLLLFRRLREMKITHEDIGRLALISCSLTIVVAFAQYYYITRILHAGDGQRATALSGNPLFLSGMFVPMLFLCWLGFARRSRNGQYITALIFAAGTAATAIALGARAAFLTILLMLPVLFAFVMSEIRMSHARKLLILLAAIAFAGLIVIVLPIANPEFTRRLSTLFVIFRTHDLYAITDVSALSRVQHWSAAWQAVLDRPFSGYGFRTDAAVVAKYLPQGAMALPTVHQQYLSFGITAGVFGLIAGVAYLALPIINAIVMSLSKRDTTRLYAGFALAAPFLLNGFTDTIFDDLRIQGYYSVMTMVLLCAHSAPQDTPPTTERPSD